ncbi:hypothetical protein BD414DRAFT_219271 [Trametes punicea]|nr:hypothetical protein BD414DRAFT_219271 [Trametes punicea]
MTLSTPISSAQDQLLVRRVQRIICTPSVRSRLLWRSLAIECVRLYIPPPPSSLPRPVVLATPTPATRPLCSIENTLCASAVIVRPSRRTTYHDVRPTTDARRLSCACQHSLQHLTSSISRPHSAQSQHGSLEAKPRRRARGKTRCAARPVTVHTALQVAVYSTSPFGEPAVHAARGRTRTRPRTPLIRTSLTLRPAPSGPIANVDRTPLAFSSSSAPSEPCSSVAVCRITSISGRPWRSRARASDSPILYCSRVWTRRFSALFLSVSRFRLRLRWRGYRRPRHPIGSGWRGVSSQDALELRREGPLVTRLRLCTSP